MTSKAPVSLAGSPAYQAHARVEKRAAGTRRRAAQPLTARDREICVESRFVPAPYAPGTYETTTFNSKIDILERERKNFDSVDVEAVIQAGRMCQAVWERAAGGRMGSSIGAVDRTTVSDHEMSVALAADDAIKVRDFDAMVIGAVGSYGMRVLRRYLVEGQTFRGHCGVVASERMVSQEAAYFRRTLKNLADALGASGPERGRICAARDLA